MKKNNFETILYSTGGVIALLAVIVGFNVIATAFKQRIDLTAERAFTLSKGTRAILGKLDTPIKIRLYYSQSKPQMPVALKTYAQHVIDLLDEYRQAGKGKIEIEKLDPEPDSDAEESANLDGVQGEMTADGEKLYLGVAISQLDEKVSIPFLSPERERLLEYDVSRAVARVQKPQRPTIGVMSPLPIFGQAANPFLQRMGQQGGSAWVFVDQLKEDFTVKQVDIGADKIDDDIKVLVVVHPKDITEATQFAIDQFVMRGGKLLAFLDPYPYFDRSGANQMNPMMGGAPGSTLDKLLPAWGLGLETGKVISDANFATRVQQGPNPSILSINADGINSDDIVTGDIDSLLLVYAGAFTGTPTGGLKETVLIKSTKSARLVDRMMAQFNGQEPGADNKPANVEYAVAVRLTGKFKSGFPGGKPGAKEDEKPAAAGKDAKPDAKPATKTDNSLKESADDKGVVILVADMDMLNDAVCADVQEVFGQRIISMRNGNLAFLQNAVESLAGDENLIEVRSRATMHRPFTVVKKMQAAAEASYQDKIKELQDSLSETQRKISDLQKNKQPGQKFILSPEQQAEVANYRKQESSVSKQLRALRKNLRQDIDSLENRLKWTNIAAVPAAVVLTGILLAMIKRKRTAAK